MAEKEWILINKNEPLNPGERIRMYYGIVGPTYFMAAQIATIEKKLESDPRFTLIKTSLPEGDGWVKDIWFEILIKKPKTPPVAKAAVIVTVAVIAAIIASAFSVVGITIWLVFREARKFVEAIEPGAVKDVIKETGWTAMKIGAAAIAGVIALNWRKK